MSFAHATAAQQESPGFSRGEDVKVAAGSLLNARGLGSGEPVTAPEVLQPQPLRAASIPAMSILRIVIIA